ncbi:MAG: Lrp/AsnC ligand binding domain-containing protein [Deltaproteobacteria bacterium]|nr:Lrp/AsnC ligand binding domain-containing protein [Deltaproteobacteria bacterium]
MTGAYVLINCSAGKVGSVLRSLRRMGVKEARAVTGLHDIVAFVQAPNPNALGRVVVEKIQTAEGVQRTITMVAVKV